MKLFFPDNIFSKLIAAHIPPEPGYNISYRASSVISKELEKSPDAIGLIPVMDLISHKEFYISSKLGLSFESVLCNSYLYYNSGEKQFKDIYLAGDISSQEVILSKIIFKELYDAQVEMHLLADNDLSNKNLIICGDKNFDNNNFVNGISLADEVIENLNLPYVNFLFASGNKDMLSDFQSLITALGEKIYTDVEKDNFGKGLNEIAREYIRSNIASMIVDFDFQDLEGLEQLIRLPYFYGMIQDMIEVKYV